MRSAAGTSRVEHIDSVKADSLFSYQPPINLVALCIMYPASYILTPRWFHKARPFVCIARVMLISVFRSMCS